jgi:hypothetical protein
MQRKRSDQRQGPSPEFWDWLQCVLAAFGFFYFAPSPVTLAVFLGVLLLPLLAFWR